MRNNTVKQAVKEVQSFINLPEWEQLVGVGDDYFRDLQSNLAKINKKVKEIREKRESEYKDKLVPTRENLVIFSGLTYYHITRIMNKEERVDLKKNFIKAMNNKKKKEEYLNKFNNLV